MKSKHSRKANASELDQIYMMGYDVWADGSQADYLVACRNSPKYARGQWYVLENEDGALTSSLIVYKLEANKYGIGSIATPKALRKQGRASQLISNVLQQIQNESKDATIFLYSDIDPEFYRRLDFVPLPQIAQRYETTTCMVRGTNIEAFPDKAATPEYF